MNLWQLDLDAAKTLFWSTRAQDRTALKRLGKQVVSQTADLGGAMRFCRRKGAGSQQVRIDALAEYILRQAFWLAALHAIGITLLPWKTIQGLRTQAVRALGFGLAGANSALRLSLLTNDMCSDPGFISCGHFMLKQSDLLELWISYMDHYDGTWFSGPFSKLIEQFDLIGWTICNPPKVRDHDGGQFNLLQVSSSCLKGLFAGTNDLRVRLHTELISLGSRACNHHLAGMKLV